MNEFPASEYTCFGSPYVRDLIAFEDESGPVLFSCGYLPIRGHIAKHNGWGWVPVDGGITDGRRVRAMEVFDDGSGPALFVGGDDLYEAGGVLVRGIAKWNASDGWSAAGNPYAMNGDHSVRDFAVFDDGSGPVLIMTGKFEFPDWTNGAAVAQWDGQAWNSLGAPFGAITGGDGGWVFHEFDDGTGPALYVGGRFRGPAGSSLNNIARWNGSEWSSLGDGILGTDSTTTVYALAAFDDGSGESLYAGGYFELAGGQPIANIAKWDGLTWSQVGGVSGIDGHVMSLIVHDDGQGPALYAAVWWASGTRTGGIFKLSSDGWERLSWVHRQPRALRVPSPIDDRLYTLGVFSAIDDFILVNGIAVLDDSRWSRMGNDFAGTAYDAFVPQNNPEQKLYIAGNIANTGNLITSNIASWNGSQWEGFGDGLAVPNVGAIVEYDDGTGTALYAAEIAALLQDPQYAKLHRWDGAQWNLLDGDFDGIVNSMTVFDPGDGERLIVAGDFSQVGSLPASSIVSFDGSEWTALGKGINGAVLDMTVLETDQGPVLIAAGHFFGSGGAVHLGQWDGRSWAPIPGGGIDGTIHSVDTFDDGSGLALYVAGDFRLEPGAIRNFARWDGAQWSAVPRLFDGPVIEIGHLVEGDTRFQSAVTGRPSTGLAVSDGSGWRQLDDDIQFCLLYKASVAATIEDDRPVMYLVGQFTADGDRPAQNIAKWVAHRICIADCDENGSVNTLDFVCFLNFYNTSDPRADVNGDGRVNTLDFIDFLNAYNEGC